MAGGSRATKTETEKVVDTNKLPSDEKVAVVTKHKNNASVIPAKKRLVKRMMFDSRGHVGRKDKRTSHIVVVVSDNE